MVSLCGNPFAVSSVIFLMCATRLSSELPILNFVELVSLQVAIPANARLRRRRQPTSNARRFSAFSAGEVLCNRFSRCEGFFRGVSSRLTSGVTSRVSFCCATKFDALASIPLSANELSYGRTATACGRRGFRDRNSLSYETHGAHVLGGVIKIEENLGFDRPAG